MTELWLTPEYTFRVHKKGARGKRREIIIDVTKSAPYFTKVSDSMKYAFVDIERRYLKGKSRIIDFGAGRLRNTLYLLRRGHKVFPVEFQKMFQTETGKLIEKKLHRYSSHFRHVRLPIYPHKFLNWRVKVDLVLLANVLNIMPIPAERDIVLQECYNKLKKNGYLLLCLPYGDVAYRQLCTESKRIGDGFYLRERKSFQTFYREFTASEIDSIMFAHGFELVHSYQIPRNHCRLYCKTTDNPLKRVVSIKRIRSEIRHDHSVTSQTSRVPETFKAQSNIEIDLPDPPALSHPVNLIRALQLMPKGWGNHVGYANLVRSVLEYVFVPKHLSKIEAEKPLFEGRKRVDTLGSVGDSGFFSILNRRYGIVAPYIHIECKNFSKDIGNREFDQLKGRFSKTKGQFGIIICRDIDNNKLLLKRCRDASSADHYIIVLTDVQLIELIEIRSKNRYKGIDDFLSDLLEEILLL